MSCAGITVGATHSCADPLQPGVRQRLLLGNLSDIATITRSVTPGEENIITGITMALTKAMFAFEGVNQSIAPQYSMIPGTVSIGYDHQVDFSVFDVSGLQKINLQAMAFTPQFAIIENMKDSSLGDSIFEVFGINRGLEMITNVRINADNDTGGAFVLQLKTSDNGGKESTMPDNFFLTDLATTEPLIEALLVPAV